MSGSTLPSSALMVQLHSPPGCWDDITGRKWHHCFHVWSSQVVGDSAVSDVHQPVTLPGCSKVRMSVSVANLCLSAPPSPSSPTAKVTFTHLPFSVAFELFWSGLVRLRSVTPSASLSVNRWTLSWSGCLDCSGVDTFSTASSTFTALISKEMHLFFSELWPFCSWLAFCFSATPWKPSIQSRVSPFFSAERWSLNQRTMSVRPRLVCTSSWLYCSGDGHWVRQNVCQGKQQRYTWNSKITNKNDMFYWASVLLLQVKQLATK